MKQNAYAHGLHCGGLRAVAKRLAADHDADAMAAIVQKLHDDLTAVAFEEAAESHEYDSALARGYTDGLAKIDKPMTAPESAAMLAYLVASLQLQIAA